MKYHINQDQINILGNILGELPAKFVQPGIDILRLIPTQVIESDQAIEKQEDVE